MDYSFLFSHYEANCQILLNPLKTSYEIRPEKPVNNIPYDYEEITPECSDYEHAIKNFLSNENSTIPQNHRLLIKNVWFYYNKNAHNKYSIYAFCAGFDNFNKDGKYPFLTAPFQINTHKNCKLHNEDYNGKFYTQVTILTDLIGNYYPVANKLIFSAYHADKFNIALKQIIFVLNKFYEKIKLTYQVEIEDINKVKIPALIVKRKSTEERKIWRILVKKFIKLFITYKNYQKSKDADINLNIHIVV